MRIASITAGAAGMFCGSCMRDNTLAAALRALGHDALLIPTYTPIRTDEEDVSQKRIFFGGINVYLQQKTGLFRHTPRWLDRLWNGAGLLRWVSKFAMSVRAEELGDLSVSMLEGSHGHQRKEVDTLVTWLETEWRPDVILLTNVLLSGIVPELKQRLSVPVIATLQGDDIFLESLPEPARRRSMELIHANCRDVDAYIATCRYYADFMSEYLNLPAERMHVVYPGIKIPSERPTESTTSADGVPTIGYFARIAPEKGLHVLVDAFIILRATPGVPRCRLRIAGWLGAHQRDYLQKAIAKIEAAGLADDFERVDCPGHADKLNFLQSIDVLSVPTTYREPKGLYILEALSQGIPVVQPRHGSFPELLEMTGGGILVTPDHPADLAQGLRQMIENPSLRQAMGQAGRIAVEERFTADVMARDTLTLIQKVVASSP